MACCVAVVYLFSLVSRAVRWTVRLGARLVGATPAPEAPAFAPPARREVRLPAGVPTS